MADRRQAPAWEVRMSTGKPVASQASVANSFGARLKGLLGRRSLLAGEALIFPRCGAIHTVGMRFPIDLIFVDRQWRIVGLQADVRPWRVVGPVLGAWGVVEMAAGTLKTLGLQVGDQLGLGVSKNPMEAPTL